MNNQDRENLKKLRNGEVSSKRNPKSYWEKDDDEKLTALFRDGFGISEFALMMNRTERDPLCNELNISNYMKHPENRTNLEKAIAHTSNIVIPWSFVQTVRSIPLCPESSKPIPHSQK